MLASLTTKTKIKRGVKLDKQKLQSPAETQQPAGQVSMQQWREAALSSDDIRDRIAVTGGLSRGIFGCLHFGNGPAPNASNDSEYEDNQRCA